MRLKRLELQGFKSFLDRTILTFEPGITGVVGPNGCGKSNIVDAIQWVMGEQSAKHLRGDSMTDVIFNGSDAKAATSMAEVTLVLDREGVPLSPTFAAFDKSDEVGVTRRVYRDGNGEYLINKTPCRLKDIHELFMDTGVGKRAYSIIEQGQIDRMINVKPDERRAIFEEVAGVTKYKAKRREAEKKLELTRQNLLRVNDILVELEKQIRSLKNQATRARKYKELKTELEIVDLFLIGKDIYALTDSLRKLRSELLELQTQKAESDAQYAELQARETQVEIQRIDQEKRIDHLSLEEKNGALDIQRMENQLQLFNEQKRHLMSNADNAAEELRKLCELLQDLEKQEGELKSWVTELESELQNIQDAVSDYESKLEELETERKNTIQEREKLVGSEAKDKEEFFLVSQRREYALAERGQVEQQILECSEKIEVQNKKCQEQANVLNELFHQMTTNTGEIEKANGEVALVSGEVEQVSQDLTRLDENISKTREEFHQTHSRSTSLQELQKNLEGYSPTAKEILSKLDAVPFSVVALADVIQPDTSSEELMEALLGEEMHSLIVQTAQDAKQLVDRIEQEQLQKVRVVSLDTIEEPVFQGAQEGTPILTSLKVKEGYERLTRALFQNVFVVENKERLFELRSQFPNVTWVTSSGRLIAEKDRTLLCGVAPNRVGIFARKREIEELIEKTNVISKDLGNLELQRENLFQHLNRQEKLKEDLRQRLSTLHITAAEQRKEKERLQAEQSRLQREREQWEREQTQAVSKKEQIDREEQELLQKEQNLKISLERYGQLRVECEEKVNRIELDTENGREELEKNRIELTRSEEKGVAAREKLHSIEEKHSQESIRMASLEKQRLHAMEGLEAIERQAISVTDLLNIQKEKHKEILTKLVDEKNYYQELHTEASELRFKIADLQRTRENFQARIQEIELDVTKQQAEEDQINQVAVERYQTVPAPLPEEAMVEIEKLPLLVEQLDGAWTAFDHSAKMGTLRDHLTAVKEKVGRYGEVNLTAIHEFDEIQKRFDFLGEQKTDLEKSITMLEDAIKKIDESTRFRFVDTFEAVNAKFKEIFPILFSGGKAELELVQSENILESGIDILVHPPGKKPSSITLLSGGEKALTAVSLVLAIFARKPSPFCLLDEVDAPLDDANVSRFNTVVKKMSEKTQFILITHNKKTMEVAQALYGVTMERSGISKMASVRLH